MSGMQKIIERKLIESLSPKHLVVENQSFKHKGHAGDDGSGESHFSVVISSGEFEGLGRIECHRAVVSVLKDEMEATHSISISVEL